MILQTSQMVKMLILITVQELNNVVFTKSTRGNKKKKPEFFSKFTIVKYAVLVICLSNETEKLNQ